MIKKTECMTFPRSGHHLLLGMLQQYFGEDLHYCRLYRDRTKTLRRCPATNFQKNHDFHLLTTAVPGRNYIVQLRNPIDSIISYYELWKLNKKRRYRRKCPWLDFARHSLDYWMDFTHKWALADIPNRHLVIYEELTRDTRTVLAGVIEAMLEKPAHVDMEAVNRIVAATPMKPARRREDFAHMDEELFSAMEVIVTRSIPDWNLLQRLVHLK